MQKNPRKTRTRKLTPKEKSRKVKENSSLSQEEINSLEQMIKKNEEKADLGETGEIPGEFITETERASPSLQKINPPQRNPVRLEENFIEDTSPISSTNSREEENPINYNLVKKNEEQKYQTISPEYQAIQKESRMQNPHLVVKQNRFVDLERKNIVENISRQAFNPISDETLKGREKNEDYIFKSSFKDRERKPHNPLEKTEIKYDVFEQ